MNFLSIIKYVAYFLAGVTILLCAACKRHEGNQLFKEQEAEKTNILFRNTIQENDSINILEFLSVYNGGGIGAGDFNNDGLIDLYFVSNQGSNRLYFNRGNLKFEDVTKKAGVEGLRGIDTWSNGVTIVDINEDGLPDIYLCMMHGHLGLRGINQLFVNNGDGTFTESASHYNLDISSFSQHAAFFDFDKDGDLDMYLLNQAVHTIESFKPAINRQKRSEKAGDRLYENVNGKFQDVSEEAGIYGGAMGYGLAVSTGDINNDGWQDIFVSNDFHENDYLYYNKGDGTFKESVTSSMGHLSKSSMGNDLGDFDNDGDLDILTLDMKPPSESVSKQTSGIDPYPTYRYKLDAGYHYQFSRNMLHQNIGELIEPGINNFSEIGQLLGVAETDWSWSGIMADLDNDGLKDLLITNGIPNRPNSLDYRRFVNSNTAMAEATPSLELIAMMPGGRSSNFAFKNNGLTFDDKTLGWGLDWEGYSNGALCVDLDNDGDLEIVLNNLEDQAKLYKNRSTEIYGRNNLTVRLIKGGCPFNFPGNEISLSYEGKLQFQSIKSTSGWLSSYVGPIAFGLGAYRNETEVNVTWDDGRISRTIVPKGTEEITIRYEDSYEPLVKDTLTDATFFDNISEKSGVHFVHSENGYNNIIHEPLIPLSLSNQGPKIAVGDVNGDLVQDFFIGGGRGQPARLFLGNTGNDSLFFSEASFESFKKHKMCEDMDAVFFDVENDGDLDLYVVSGGDEIKDYGDLEDRLYLNDGFGTFSFYKEGLPRFSEIGSCAIPIDANKDGYLDLFVGGRHKPGAYGLGAKSKILINNNGQKFHDETGKYLENGGKIGMVSDGIWVDQRSELVLVGEWMPVTIIRFSDHRQNKVEIPNSGGWWNVICGNDLDNDGDMDFLVGNTGRNLELSASSTDPIELYVKDFDGNAVLDPIIAYTKNGRKWVYPGLDELITQMPPIRQVFGNYRIFAQNEFNEIFPKSQLHNCYKASVQTLSSVLIENKEGNYKIHDLPLMSQISPIYGFAVKDFDDDGCKDVLAVGNVYENQPSIGKFDASFGTFLRGKGNLTFEYVEPMKSGFALGGEARDIKIVSAHDNSDLMLISRNGMSLCLFK